MNNLESPITLEAPEMEKIEIKPITKGKLIKCRIWAAEGEFGIDQGNAAQEFFKKYLGIQECHLLRFADSAKKYLPNSRKYVTNFADSHNIEICNEASLEELNTRLVEKVPMDRFRPNITIKGPAAWDEESWKRVKVG
jgi:uncharacterized protein YcbX